MVYANTKGCKTVEDAIQPTVDALCDGATKTYPETTDDS